MMPLLLSMQKKRKKNMFQVNLEMTFQKRGEMSSEGQGNKKKRVNFDESSSSSIRFHLAKVGQAMADKQTEELPLKHDTFLRALL